MIRYLLALSLPFVAISAYAEDTTKIPQELTAPNYRVSEISGIGAEPDVERQDPSNVIKVGDIFYVWYTRRKAGVHPYASTVYFATSKDGRNWTEKGEALGKEASGGALCVGVAMMRRIGFFDPASPGRYPALYPAHAN